jgi:hypothetical protein
MLKLDMHVHTRGSSDSLAPLNRIFARCRERGLDGVAITDHNTVSGALELAANVPPGMILIVGEEITSRDGEIIGYFLKTGVRRGMPLADTLQTIHEQGGLACIPHPFGTFRRHLLDTKAAIQCMADIDMVEVFNARNLFYANDRKAAKLAAEYDKPGTAGSDAHSLWELGTAYTETAQFSSPAQFLENMKTAKLHTAKSSMLAHSATACAKTARRLGLEKLLPEL